MGPLPALGRHIGALSVLGSHIPCLVNSCSRGSFSRSYASNKDGSRHAAIYVTDADNWPITHTPFMIGLMNYFERHIPYVGLFSSVAGTGGSDSPHPVDKHLQLIHAAFNHRGADLQNMIGATEDEATKAMAAGKLNDLLDKIYGNFAAYKEEHDLVVVEGASIGGSEFDAQIAGALNTPVLLGLNAEGHATAGDLFNLAMLKRQIYLDHKVGCD